MQCRAWTGHCLFIVLAQSRSARRAQCLACDGDVFQCSTCLPGFHAKCDAQMGELIKVRFGSARGEDGRVMALF